MRVVTRDATHLTRIEFDGGEALIGTPIHRIWSHDRQEWVEMQELVPGEQVLSRDGPVRVTNVSFLPQASPVYNLETHGEHTFARAKS